MGPSVGESTTTWDEIVAFAVYVAILTAAYYYNVTLVQLGLTEVGQGRLGLSMELVAAAMGTLAIATLTATLVSGHLVDRFGWGTDVRLKFRVLFGILLLLLGLTSLLPLVASFLQFLAWVLACALLVGTAIPFAFSLMLDLVAPGKRGYAAGLVAGGAFALAAWLPFEWAAGNFVGPAVAVLLPVVVLLAVLSVAPGTVSVRFQRQHGASPEPTDGRRMTRTPVVVGLVLLFGAFFVDSLGFVRIIETPAIVDSSWQSSDRGIRATLAVTHVVGGLAAGVLYTKLRYLWLFVATFALFAAAQFLYAFDIAVGGPSVLGTATPLVYVLAVSCYTVVAFALWPDLATPETVGTYTGVGIGIGGWLATFTSTALALASDQLQLAVERHLLAVGVLSCLFVLLTVSLWYLTDAGGAHAQ